VCVVFKRHTRAGRAEWPSRGASGSTPSRKPWGSLRLSSNLVTLVPLSLATSSAEWGVGLVSGEVSEDLRWGELRKLFVVGALASLQVGPDAGNLMGLRRAAHTVAKALDLQAWLRDSTSSGKQKGPGCNALKRNIRGNRFAAFQSDSDSDAESDEDSTPESDSKSEVDSEAKDSEDTL
jgi:hypothetical protein